MGKIGLENYFISWFFAFDLKITILFIDQKYTNLSNMQLQRTFFYNNLGFTQIHAVKFVKKIQCTGSLAFQLH